MAQQNLVSLGGVELTDQGRTFDEDQEPKVVDVDLANGSKKRYLKANKRRFNLSWSWLPSLTSKTYDAKGGRDSVRTLAYAGTTHSFVVRNNYTGSSETYTVLVESYSEKLLRRDTDAQFWDVSLSLMEV